MLKLKGITKVYEMGETRVDALKSVETHGPDLAGAAPEHYPAVKSDEYARQSARSHPHSALQIDDRVRHRRAERHLASRQNDRHLYVLEHERQHG
jgi:hypothetical protein